MKKIIILLLVAAFVGCIPGGTNSKKTASMSSSAPIDDERNITIEKKIETKPTINIDSTIEFKNTDDGYVVCRYPSGGCRTDADEGSGGSSAYGEIPDSSNSFIHYMKFKFYSSGYFAKNPAGHIAFGLRGQRLRVEEFGADAGVDGRGIIIGNIGFGYHFNKNNIACVDRMAQVESYFRTALTAKKAPSGNIIIPSTCTDTIFEDNQWYSIEIEVTKHQYIIYRIFNADNKLIYQSYYNDQPNYIDSKLTGWFVGHVFGDPKEKWSFKLKDFEVGHIAEGDTFYPVKNFESPLVFSTRYGYAKGESANNFSIVLNRSKTMQIKLQNVYNRKRLFGCASVRTSKTGADNVDCSKSENYRTMTFSSETDWVLNGTALELKESFAKTIPNGFYTIYFRQNPQDFLSQVSLSMELRD